jgi:UrcA family protein
MKTVAILTAAALSLSLIAQAQAAPPSLTIGYSDVDLSSVQGESVLYKRLSAAAKTVCHDFEFTRETSLSLQLKLPQLHAACMRQAIDSAVARVNQPAFTSYVAALSEPSSSEFAQVARK